MANQKMKDDWKLVKKRIRSMWHTVDFTDKELETGRSKLPNMVTLIKAKTGEERRVIRKKMIAVIGVAYRPTTLASR